MISPADVRSTVPLIVFTMWSRSELNFPTDSSLNMPASCASATELRPASRAFLPYVTACVLIVSSIAWLPGERPEAGGVLMASE